MPSIYLKQTQGSYSIVSGTVSVQEDTYNPSKLFKRYTHTLTSPTQGKIYLSDRKYVSSNYLTITTNNGYKDAKLTEAHVYFNTYDNKCENPLVLVLKFQNGGTKIENKYYKASVFNSKIECKETVGISTLCKYENDNSILKDLLKENDSLKDLLTYQIEKKKGDNGNGLYNGDKIKVEEDSRGDPALSGNGFTRYKHTPVSGNGHGDKKACVIYDGNVLLGNGDTELRDIQKEQYKCIKVYMGDKAKKTSVVSGSQIDVPLLIELNKTSPPSEPEYYVHKRDPSDKKYYWEKLPGSDGNGEVLCNLLTDMGFGMTSGERGYEQLKQLLSTANVNGIVDGEDLSTKLGQVTGTKLKKLLQEKVGDSGSSQKLFLELLLKQIEFNLVDSVVILLEKRPPSYSTYGETAVRDVVDQLEPKRDINRVKMENGGKIITVNDQTADKGSCVQTYKYKVYEHNFSTLVQEEGQSGQSYFGIRFIMPSGNSASQYKQLSLYSSIQDQAEPQNLEYKYYHNSGRNGISPTNSDKVYVWFYDKDPRPLMLCYNNTTYAPKDKDTYFTQWVKVELNNGSFTLKDCGCSQGQGVHTPEDNNELLKQLDRVVKFLNRVNLKEGTSESGSGRGPHKYEVQKFKGSDIQIQVTCSPVGGTTGSGSPEGTCSSSPNGKSCYKKFEHKPAGIQNGLQNGSGFRLGQVEYIRNGGVGKTTSTLNYYELHTNHKYNPLVGVTVYYYQHDKNYDDPLLVELEFKSNGGLIPGGDGSKEYYKLQPNGNGGDGIRTWKLDTDAQNSMRDPRETQKQVNYLDSIRYSLKPAIKILIDKQTGYDLCLSEPGGQGDTYRQESNTIQVEQCSENGCTGLANHGYKCYEHKISEINGYGPFDYNRIGGLKFFISGKNGEAGGSNDIEIKLHKENGGGSMEQIKELTYNTRMQNIYVFFYCKNGTKQSCPTPESSKPTAPLMLLYNSKYYRPADIENYFKHWICEKGLQGTIDKPCCVNGESQTLLDKLKEVNKALNRIKLTETGVLQYGIPTDKPLPPKQPDIDVNRVQVTKINGTDNRPYCKLVHRTINSFTIGDIYYGSKNITGGVTIKGGTTSIALDTNHTSFVNKNANSPNTVVAYYSSIDTQHTLPQLIVLLQTDGPIPETADKPITASSGTSYGYYVLATADNGGSYKYEWREPSDEQVTLNDETEFSLLNAIIILVDKQNDQYKEGDISSAVSTSQIRSPGNLEGVNRLKDRTINPHEETGNSAGSYGNPGQCISKYGYKLYSHDIGTLVIWQPTGQSNGQHGISLIGGLRFLVPSSTSSDGYEEIKLYSNQDTTSGPVQRLYHEPASNKNKVYVFFYGKDPRPLLFCYNGNAYKPFKQAEPTAELQVNVNYTKWVKATEASQCTCMGEGISGNDDHILDALLEVVCFLNPVQLNPFEIPREASSKIINPTKSPRPEKPTNSTYELHKFTPDKTVQLKIARADVKCYEKYTYEPHGTSGDKTGFRLGKVLYHGILTATPKGTVKYPCDLNGRSTANTRNYNPLLKVDAYYYDKDMKFMDPLLVVLHFKRVGTGDADGPKEYWKLKTRDTSKIEWSKDEAGDGKMKSDPVGYLDTIRYSLKKLVRISIERNRESNYPLTGRQSSNKDGPFEPIGKNNQIKVEEPNDISCSNLKDKGYVCFRHTLTLLQPHDHHKIGGVVMTLPSNKGANEAIEIPLHDSDNGQQKQLYYNSCMGHLTVYVYFYVIKCGGPVDTVPLMVWYNDQWYKPNTRDDYFTKWIHEKKLDKFTTPCGNGKLGKEDYKTLATKLEMVNRELNRIELTHQINSKSTSEYGIPKPRDPPNEPQINLNRVKVTQIPTQVKADRPYVKLIHRTVNEFRIGEIWYEGKDITKNSIIIKKNGDSNGNTIISVDRLKNHTSFTDANRPNTVVVYYSCTDNNHKVPQLILLMSTDKVDYQPIASSTNNNKYGYYIINHSDGYCSHFKYYWIQPTEDPPPKTPLKLDDTTELSLLNSVVILLEKKPGTGDTSERNGKYGDEEINKAVERAIQSESLKPSPGLDKDINRLKGKDITPTDETGQGTGKFPLSETGFKVIAHDISKFVKLEIPGAQDVTLIARLIFLIPTPKGEGEYTLVSLYESVDRKENVTLFHQKAQNNVCVFFYGEDPRPMLFCYGDNAYRPFSKNNYFSKWVFDDNSGNSDCSKIGEPILRALVHVSNFLNPVFIKRTFSGDYRVHTFNGKHIKIQLQETKAQSSFCYNKYVHSPKPGYRVGDITYAAVCIFRKDDPDKCINSLITDKHPFEAASEVVVYYYKLDESQQNPLLVVLCKKPDSGVNGSTVNCICQPYYELQRSADPSITKKIYEKETDELKLDPSKGGQLETILDRILYYIRKSLRIDLSFRKTTEIKYMEKNINQRVKKYHGKYPSRVYENKSKSEQVKTSESIIVHVSGPIEILNDKKEKTGYKCYQHKLTIIKNVNQIGGLRLFLWDNRGTDEQDNDCTVTEPTNQEKKKCCEITLWDSCNQGSKQIEPIAYTTCKGDLYVYFYGSDPRPLLLCYNGQAYKPNDLNTYITVPS